MTPAILADIPLAADNWLANLFWIAAGGLVLLKIYKEIWGKPATIPQPLRTVKDQAVATKFELAEVKTELSQDIAGVREEVHEIRQNQSRNERVQEERIVKIHERTNLLLERVSETNGKLESIADTQSKILDQLLKR